MTNPVTANDLMFGGAAVPVSFEVGTTVTGVLVAMDVNHRKEVKYNPATDSYDQGELQYWDEEKTRPKYDPVLTLQTDDVDDEIEGDDGLRRVFVKGRSKANPGSLMDACRAAKKAAGVKQFELGGTLTFTCTGEGERTRAMIKANLNAPKIYTASYTPPDPHQEVNDAFDQA
jgi:hypothetical protein